MLTFRQLEVVQAVCLHGSATLAADVLGVSQPAVSAILRSAADDAGFALFVRKNGRLQPTAETKVLLGYVDTIFDTFQWVNRLVHELRESSIGAVHVTATPVLATNFLPAVISCFHQNRPKIQVRLETVDNLGVLHSVIQNRVDFGLVLAPIGKSEARSIELASADLIAVVHPDHPLARNGSVTCADLARYPLISFGSGLPLGHLIEQAFKQAGVTRRIALEVNQSSTAGALVRAGAGVAVLDPFFMMDQHDHGVVRLKLIPSVAVKAQILVARGSTLSRPARLLLREVRQAGGALWKGERERHQFLRVASGSDPPKPDLLPGR